MPTFLKHVLVAHILTFTEKGLMHLQIGLIIVHNYNLSSLDHLKICKIQVHTQYMDISSSERIFIWPDLLKKNLQSKLFLAITC